MLKEGGCEKASNKFNVARNVKISTVSSIYNELFHFVMYQFSCIVL